MKDHGITSRVSQTFSGDKVPKLTKAIYPWSGIFRDACYALVGTFLLQYAMTAGVLSSDVEVYKSQMQIITIFMMLALVWDGINDPIMGFIVERVHFKTGKYKPEHEKLLQKLLETKVEFYDIWTMACMTLCQQKTFLANAKYTKRGNIITNAETVYNYITDQTDFIEDHTAFSDACIEAEILARIFANGCKPQKQVSFPFRLIPKELYQNKVA